MLCNYRPISLLFCISKVFDKILFNHIYTFLKENKLFNCNQLGFTTVNSTINQLITICYKIHCQLDNDDEVLTGFLNLIKPLTRFGIRVFYIKTKENWIIANLLKWIESYLSNRKQRVVINGTKSNILQLHAGGPQWSVLGFLLFLICI